MLAIAQIIVKSAGGSVGSYHHDRCICRVMLSEHSHLFSKMAVAPRVPEIGNTRIFACFAQ